MLITLSGLDGAGKTTLVGWLRRELEASQRRVTVLHFNDHVGVYACLRALRNVVTGRIPLEGPPRMAPHPRGLGRLRDAILWSRLLRRLLYPVDLLMFLCLRGYVEWLRGRVLIMDRYFYDRLVDVADGRHWRSLRWLVRVTPTPDLAVFLVVAPEDAFARKGEYTIPYLRARDRAYRTIFAWVRRGLRVPAGTSDDTRTALARALEERRLA